VWTKLNNLFKKLGFVSVVAIFISQIVSIHVDAATITDPITATTTMGEIFPLSHTFDHSGLTAIRSTPVSPAAIGYR